MSTAKKSVVLASDPAFMGALFQVAKTTAKAHLAMVAFLHDAEIAWSDEEAVKAVSRMFRIGRMAGTLGLSEDQTVLVHDKAPYAPDASNPDARRSKREQDAYNAAKVAFSYLARQAGMPKRDGSGARATRKTANDLKAEGVKAALEATGKAPAVATKEAKAQAKVEAMVTRLTSPPSNADDVAAFALQIASLIADFSKKSAKVHIGPWRTLLDDVARRLIAQTKAPVEVASPAHVPAEQLAA